MESHYHQKLLFISFFSLAIFSFSRAICVPRDLGDPLFSSITPPKLQISSSSTQKAELSPTSSPAPELSPSPTPVATLGLSADAPSTRPSTNPPSDPVPPVSNPSPGSVPPSTNPESDVNKICASTDHPALCLATVIPLLRGKNDIASVLEVAIKASTDLTRLGLSMAQKFANAPGITPEDGSILNDCIDSYDTALDDFQRATEALAASDAGTMNTMLSAVITDIGDCVDSFSGQTSPLLDYCDKVVNMASNCLAIVSLIHPSP